MGEGEQAIVEQGPINFTELSQEEQVYILEDFIAQHLAYNQAPEEIKQVYLQNLKPYYENFINLPFSLETLLADSETGLKEILEARGNVLGIVVEKTEQQKPKIERTGDEIKILLNNEGTSPALVILSYLGTNYLLVHQGAEEFTFAGIVVSNDPSKKEDVQNTAYYILSAMFVNPDPKNLTLNITHTGINLDEKEGSTFNNKPTLCVIYPDGKYEITRVEIPETTVPTKPNKP